MATEIESRQGVADILLILGRLRARVRRYVAVQGGAKFIAMVALLIWASVIVDWLFEPGRPLRAFLLLLLGVSTGYCLIRFLVGRLRVPIALSSIALLLERRFPELRDGLITAIAPADEDLAQQNPYHWGMLSATRRTAAQRIRQLDLDEVFNGQPLVRSVLLSAALAVSLIGFGLAAPQWLEIWARRSFWLSNEIYPRRTRLTVAGFENRSVKVARGADFEVVAQADTKMTVPKTVQIQYQTSGVRDRVSMDREGNADPAHETSQKYSYTFHVLSPIDFNVLGGDSRVDDLRIDVVEIPVVDVSQTYLECRFPDYLGRESREMPVTAVVSLPRGTQITLHAMANKPLVDVELTQGSDTDSIRRTIEPRADDPRHFQVTLDRLDQDQLYHFVLHDTDDIRSREPWRLALAAIADSSPLVTLRLRGIGTAITPEARIPIQGSIKDDHGLTRLWFEFGKAGKESSERDLSTPVQKKTEVQVDDALDVANLQLTPGEKFQVQVKVRDNCGLETGFNEASTEQFVLQVVSPEELRAMLEARELNLRRRFEQLLGEVTETRDSLTSPAAAEPTASAESVDPPADASPGEATTVAVLEVERAAQNSRKNADETLGVAVAFNDMHEELINNRVDTEELKLRLKNGIAEPLHRLAAEAFPELDRRFTALHQARTSRFATQDTTLAATREQLDVILVEMQQVLDKMAEMETFNEVVDMLRAVIESQKEVNEQAKSQRKQSIRNLIDE